MIQRIREDPSKYQVYKKHLQNCLQGELQNYYGGRLKDHLPAWEELTSDPTILQTVSGIKVNSEDIIPNSPWLSFPPGKGTIIDMEIKKLLHRNIIMKTEHEEGEFISPIFLRDKGDGSYRLILNLKKLNENMERQHFKMDTIHTVINLLTPNCFMAGIDLKDAYFTVPIDEESIKYFKFIHEDELYAFLGLPNGYCHGPRIFTKMMKPVISTLRLMDHIIAIYIDDLLNVGDDFDDCLRNVMDTLRLLIKLGFIIHPDKSQITPSKIITFLGFILNSLTMTIYLPDEKKRSLRESCIDILDNPHITIRRLASVIGVITSSFPGVSLGPLHYRDMEREKTVMLKEHKGKFDSYITLTEGSLKEIEWWKDNIDTAFAPLQRDNPDTIIYTDACDTGWGAVHGDCRVGGGWKAEEMGDFINEKELRAILLGLMTLFPEANNQHFLVMSDNTTAVQTINKMGSMSKSCDDIVRLIWQFIIEHECWITTAHIPGIENVDADEESRKDYDNKEWKLITSAFTRCLNAFSVSPCIDMFASRVNYQMKPFVSFGPDPEAYHVNAFTLDWQEYTPFYAFPPFPIITRVLRKIAQDKAEGIIIVPNWPNQVWYPKLMRMLTDNPLLLPHRDDLLHLPSQPDRQHPMMPRMRLLACKVSGRHGDSSSFRAKLSTSCWRGGVKVQGSSMDRASKDTFSTVVKDTRIHFKRLSDL